ncbi:MAG: hypothetical protein ACPGYT_00290 [Nitrospirales bacterium]
MKIVLGYLLVCSLLITSTPNFISAQEPEFPTPATRTLIADVLDVEGEYLILRGKLGEIRIEIKDDTKISEEFQFGDKVKAVIRPNDSAISVERAKANATTGFQVDLSRSPSSLKKTASPPNKSPSSEKQASKKSAPPAPAPRTGPKIRIIVADLLMVDGDFYVVRSGYGEIRIEATPDTTMAEAFDFGDRIKAKVLPNDKAISIIRANPEDVIGIQTLEPKAQLQTPQSPPKQKSQVQQPKDSESKNIPPKGSNGTRTIIAEVLMVDGDFIIVRGERGEIQIEVTGDTILTEQYDYGDKIKALVLPNDRAISILRATAEEPIGITQH